MKTRYIPVIICCLYFLGFVFSMAGVTVNVIKAINRQVQIAELSVAAALALFFLWSFVSMVRGMHRVSRDADSPAGSVPR
jgi:hypothetical protein